MTQIQYSNPIKCRHCGNVAPMRVIGRANDKVVEDVIDNFGPIESGTIYEVLRCPVCPEATIRKHFWHDFMDEDSEPSYTILYPVNSRTPIGLPENIEKAYQAAVKVKSVDANAFGVLIGRVIDMVCHDRGAKGRFLGHKLSDLADKGEIPTKLVTVAEKLTKLRNIGAHADLGELTEKEIPVVEDLCRALLDYIYTAPHLAKRADETLNKLLDAKNVEPE